MAKAKVTRVEEVKVPYLMVNYLAEKVNLLKVPTYGDIQKFKELQESLSLISTELQEKIKEIFDKYGVTTVNEGDEHFTSINNEYKEIVNSDSSVNREALQLFSKEEFERVYNGSDLKVADALTLEYWLVK